MNLINVPDSRFLRFYVSLGQNMNPVRLKKNKKEELIIEFLL